MIGGLGYNVLASVNRKAYLCVYEDDKSLYFLLPAGTKSFKLKGRKLDDGTTLFTGKYEVNVTETRKPKIEKSKSLEEKTEPEKTPADEETPSEKTTPDEPGPKSTDE